MYQKPYRGETLYVKSPGRKRNNQPPYRALINGQEVGEWVETVQQVIRVREAELDRQHEAIAEKMAASS